MFIIKLALVNGIASLLMEPVDETVESPSSFFSRNKTEWCKSPPPTPKERQRNILKLTRGPTRFAVQRITEHRVSAMKLFFTDDMFKLFLEETKREFQRVCSEKNKKCTLVSAEDLEACIGLQILAGLYKPAGESLKELWSDISRETMSLQRFEIIREFLRFGNKKVG